jgi:AcrR family transcriptional regulator
MDWGSVKGMSARTTRANGRASRRQILDAAAEIASEYGYQGTSISEVSKRSGLPKSSIYWHFENKEDLFIAVINDSYERWCEELADSRINADDGHSFENLYANLGQFPDFIRLGLIMTLERAPEGGHAARQRFLEIRQESLENLRVALLRDYPDLGGPQANMLAAMTLSQLDGSFVAAMAGETALTPKVLSRAVHTLAKSMIAGDTEAAASGGSMDHSSR